LDSVTLSDFSVFVLESFLDSATLSDFSVFVLEPFLDPATLSVLDLELATLPTDGLDRPILNNGYERTLGNPYACVGFLLSFIAARSLSPHLRSQQHRPALPSEITFLYQQLDFVLATVNPNYCVRTFCKLALLLIGGFACYTFVLAAL